MTEPTNGARDVLRALRARTDDMVAALDALVSIESPSSDPVACARCADHVSDLMLAMLGRRPEVERTGDRVHLRWPATGGARVLLVAHIDTVWPHGTIDRRPFTVEDGRASGPGTFDMKAGLVQGLFAMTSLADHDGIEVLVTTDEELGSPSSRALIERCARDAGAALVLEASEGGAVKVARKGVSMYRMRAVGRASHAGLEPERGVNALVELSHQVLALAPIARPEAGTTVTPTVARAGTTTNTVPAEAELAIDVRVTTVDEQTRVDEAINALPPVLPEASLEITGGPNRPPMQRSVSEALFARAASAAEALGLEPLRGVEVGGGSDGNFTAAVGTPTLDGLGPVGAGAHAEHEHVIVNAMPERAALLALLIDDLRARPLVPADNAAAADSR